MGNDQATITLLFDHNLWATKVLLHESVKLTPDQWRKPFEIGLGSMHATLRHIVGAMLRWADRIAQREVKPSIEAGGREYSPAELEELLSRADADLRATANELVARDRLMEMLSVTHEGQEYRFTKLTALIHVLTHGVHHRAQALNIRRQLGLPPLGLDLDAIEAELMKDGKMTE